MDIDYHLDGSPTAPALVLSNSLGTDLDMWCPQMSVFCKHFFVIRYNQRGHGKTPTTAATQPPLTLAQLGQDVLDLLDYLNIPQAHFCGLSMGGLTGLWLNRYHPQRIDKLVIANAAARIATPNSWQQRAQQVQRDGLQEIAINAPLRWFNAPFIQKNSQLIQTMVTHLAASDPNGYIACCLALSQADLCSEVSQMIRPMLIIAGEQDPTTTVEDAQFLQTNAPQASLLTLPASHLSNLACPDAFNTAVIDFFCAHAT